MITPDTPSAPTNEAKKSGELCIDSTALAIDGTEPEAGDEAEVQAKVKISRVENGKAFFDLAEINGQPVAHDETETDDPEDMMAVAAKADAAMDE